MGKGCVLIVDNEENLVQTLTSLLRSAGFEVVCARDGDQALTLVHSQTPDVVLLDIWLPGMDGIETLRALKGMHSEAEVIVMSGHGSIAIAVQVMQLGAFDYLEKPLSLDTVCLRVGQALHRRKYVQGKRCQSPVQCQTHVCIGDSLQMQVMRRLLESAWMNDTPVLIQGEAGSGKACVARLLHNGSERHEGPFVQCQCAGLSTGSADDLLFGHTGDLESRQNAPTRGALEHANGGTIFLDGIDFLQHEVQRKLLQVITTRMMQRVGGQVPIPLNIRLIASCTMGLHRLQEQRLVLPEFAAQLQQAYIELPPLRERKTDIPVLVQHLLGVFAHTYGGPPKELDDKVMAIFLNYNWPGNIKELSHVIERMVLTTSTNRLGWQDVPLTVLGDGPHKSYRHLAEARSDQDAKRDRGEEGATDGIKLSPLQSRYQQQQQRTLRRSVVLYGQGLQSGLKTGMILAPLPPHSGIVFRNITSGETLPAAVDFVASTDFCTSLCKGRMAAKTVEHIMSALHAYRISNLLIKISDEIPIMDGSAADFCQLLEEGGIAEQDAVAEEFIVDQCYAMGDVRPDAKFILVEPYDGFRVTYRLHYPQPLGTQEFMYEHRDGMCYRREVALARTFAFVRDVEKMHELGLVAGGRLNNVILIDDEKIVNNVHLRFPNEFARHKVLDIMGDLYLLGRPLRGHVRANMTGHTENVALVKKLRAAMLSV